MYFGSLKKNFQTIFKKLASSAWGETQNKKNIWNTDDDIINEKLDNSFRFENDYLIK